MLLRILKWVTKIPGSYLDPDHTENLIDCFFPSANSCQKIYEYSSTTSRIISCSQRETCRQTDPRQNHVTSLTQAVSKNCKYGKYIQLFAGMLSLSDRDESRLRSSRPVTTQRNGIMVIMRVHRDARQVAGVHQEPDYDTERLLVS